MHANTSLIGVPTPAGIIEAVKGEAADHPGVVIDIRTADGVLHAAAQVEWDPTDGLMHIRLWREGHEDPVQHIIWSLSPVEGPRR